MVAIDETIKIREKDYGKFENNAVISQKLKEVAREGKTYSKLSFQKKEALDMIFHKIARLVSGDGERKDTLHDIVGYAKLLEGLE
ncbi:MAG: DUF6378 domain-containing protein [Candidatus Heimdallarchaeota archaeon]|nr:DUF6378 domain-containing protein [Candidatus Heimdallarchaeota archaeon]